MSKKPYILSVEDNPNDVFLMSRIFSNKILDFDVVFLREIPAVEEFLKEQNLESNLPSLILLDIKLIKGNGLDLLEDLKKDTRYLEIPVVMLSSSGRQEDKDRAFNGGCSDYFEKPRTYNILSQALPQIVNTWAQKAS